MFEKYGPQKWWIAHFPKYATQAFSYKHVICPAANYRRPFAIHTFRVIIGHLKRAYRYWFYRCRELVSSDLWLPVAPDNNQTVIHRAVLHCLYCVPTQVLLHKNRQPIKVKPCNQYHICPFCASRAAEDLYRRVIRATEGFKETNVNVLASYRCEQYLVPAKNFSDLGWDAAQFHENIAFLRKHLKSERLRYLKLTKELSTQTLGSLWSVNILPADAGWHIEVRQFYLTNMQSRRPSNRKRKSAVLTQRSANIRDTKQMLDLLGAFVRYPGTLLTAHVELTAVALHARRGLRLLNGTGQLYRQGRETTEKAEIKTDAHVP